MEREQPFELRERTAIGLADRYLTEVDRLNRLRLIDGSHDPAVLEGTLDNLIPAVKEAAVPHAVSTTYQRYANGEFWWIDETSADVAASGYRYHWHPAALNRVPFEVEEAEDIKNSLHEGWIKVFISPKIAEFDAPREVARAEHLADDDMIRIHSLDVEGGEIKGKYMQSLLLRNVPLPAWVAMFRDPNNIFGKAFEIDNEESSLSIMRLHRELYIPLEYLPEGVITIVEAVLPYVDPEDRANIENQLDLFRSDQFDIHEKATNIAKRWLTFEQELADSLHSGFATTGILDFLQQLEENWDDDFQELLALHAMPDGSVRMSRQLAADIERSRQNTLWVSAAVITGNEEVITKLGSELSQQIYDNEILLQRMMYENFSLQEMALLEAQNNQIIAGENITVGGGCPGESSGAFASKKGEEKESRESCAIKTTCPNCSNLNVDGSVRKNKQPIKVTAIVDSAKTIKCTRCYAWATRNGGKFMGIIKMREKSAAEVTDKQFALAA